MAGLAIGIDHRGDRQIGQIAAAVTAAIHQHAVPGALPAQLRPKGFIDQAGRDLVRQHRRIAADYI